MSKERLSELYKKGLEYQKQLSAVEMSARFLTSEELGSYYEAKSEAEHKLENNTKEFEQTLRDLNNDI